MRKAGVRGPVRLDDAQEIAAIMVQCGEMVAADRWVGRFVEERRRKAVVGGLSGVV